MINLKRKLRFFSTLLLSILISGFLISCGGGDEDVEGPVIDTLSPTSGEVGDLITINGSFLFDASVVLFNQTSASIISNTETQITVEVPVGATTGKVRITTPGGAVESLTDFEVIDPTSLLPTITSFSPASALVGENVEIIGTNFAGEINLYFNETLAEIVSNVDNTIVATVPEDATSGKISVVTGTGTAISQTDFEFIIPVIPTITSVSPISGFFGDVIKIEGINFTGITTVQIGFVDAIIINTSDSFVEIEIPTGSRIGLNNLIIHIGELSFTSSSEIKFYIIKTEASLRQTFDGEYDGVYFGSKDIEENTFFGQSNELVGSGALYLPSAIDGNYFHMEGFSSTQIAGSYISQVSTGTKATGFYSSFVGDITFDQMFINLQVQLGSLPDGYGGGDSDHLFGLRVRFEGDDYRFYINQAELDQYSKGPDANGWYEASFPVSLFTDWTDIGTYSIGDFQRISVTARRDYGEGGSLGVPLDGTEGSIAHSLSFDNLIVTIGGPYSF